jgi:LytS/YehU family sensor histidine kinase
MLRYVFHDCSHDFVLLGAEINYIQNFMAFQKMKSDHKQNISFDFTSADTSVKIAPMLFIPFIENSFKYSRVEEMSEAYVKVLIKTLDRTILFRIENSLPSSGKIVNGSGMGIENVKQRLNRLYEHSFDLEVLALEDRFVVELKIDLP